MHELNLEIYKYPQSDQSQHNMFQDYEDNYNITSQSQANH